MEERAKVQLLIKTASSDERDREPAQLRHPHNLGKPRPPGSVAAAYPATAPSLVVQRLHCHLLEREVKV